MFEQRGKRVLAWGDIMVKYPDVLRDMPPRLIPVAWEYEAQPDPEYKKWLEPLVARKLPHFVQTGVANWRELAPDFTMTFDNIDTFTAAGRKSNALGLINSVWTDPAQSLLRMSFSAIAYGAIAPWQSVPVDRKSFFREYAQSMYPGPAAPEVAAALEGLHGAEQELQKALGQRTINEIWSDPFSAASLKRSTEHREPLRRARLMAEGAQEHLYRALALKADRTLLSSLLLGARLIDYAAFKYLNALEIAERWKELSQGVKSEEFWNQLASEVVYQSHGRLADMMDAISELKRAFREAWLAEYTPYRLDAALGWFDGEFEYWRRLAANFRVFNDTYREGSPFPPLESITRAR
jgi:hypothetical protein